MNTYSNVSKLPLSASRPSDILLDTTTLIRVVAQILSDGGVTDEYASELSWLLGSCKRRLEPVCELLQTFEDAGAIEHITESFRVTPIAAEVKSSTPSELSIADEISAIEKELLQRRRELNA